MEGRLPRKLAAILYADVAGYSRLTGEDEEGTHRHLSAYLDIFTQAIQGYEGRVVHYAGDAILAEFPSVSQALTCAAAVQRDLADRNEDLPEDQRVQFRIGVNLGEVIVDRDDIYGDGVNVAARLEGLAEPGGICIAESVHGAVGTRLPLEYEYLGEQQVKNIEKPVKAYRARLKADGKLGEPETAHPSLSFSGRRRQIAFAALLAVVVVGALAWLRPWTPELVAASPGNMAYPLPDKPSIAVLPFDNLSGDPEKEYMVDGMTEQIISSLARNPEIFVVARNSTLVYKDEPVEVREVAEDLGVQYVLEGSLQTSGERVRVTAQLIDALSGLHVWSEQYDRDLDDLFDLLDDITLKLAIAMAAELAWGERAYIESRSATDLKAWLLVQQGEEQVDSYTPDGLRRGRELFLKALDRDPNYAIAWQWLAWTHFFDAFLGYSDSRSESLRLVGEYTDKAASIDPESTGLYNLRGRMHLIKDEIDKAVEYGQKAVDAAPGNSLWIAGFAQISYFSGEFDRCIELMLKAKRLSPRHPAWYDLYLGRAYAMIREYDLAQEAFRRLTTDEVSPVMAAGGHTGLAFVFIENGQGEEARAEIDKARARFSWVSVAFYEGVSHFKDPVHWERFAAALRKAGLPETSG